MKSIPLRIGAVRAIMESNKVDAYIIPTADPHQSEYVPDHWSHRNWISGFTGSAGTVIITASHAGLWTDSRYFLQANQQLKGSRIALHKLKVQTQAEYLDWICSQLKPGQVVGCDFWCFSYSQIQMFDKILTAKGLILKDTGDLVGQIWGDRPGFNDEVIYEHAPKLAGSTREEKLKKLKTELKNAGAEYMLLSALDEIAYLLNLRGKDVHCNPVFVAYLLVGQTRSILFVPQGKLPDELLEKLAKAQVYVASYEDIQSTLRQLGTGSKLMVDPATINAKLALQLQASQMIQQPSPVMKMKAIKGKVEAAHIRAAMEKDGVALTKAFMWLELLLKKGKTCTERDFAMQIAFCRAQQKGYVGESFDAIIGYNANGAIIHYKPDEKKSARIRPKGILLVDSGGQYKDGTTDITRTIALAKPTVEMKQYYTAVLMGHIALADAVFPEGTKGIQLDVLARQYLWKLSENYAHGTGHGVGFFMNVHEPPQGFVSVWNQRGQTEMVEGMLTSNEPGYYKEAAFGIRIENLVLNRVHSKSPSGKFLNFETVTLFPIDTSLIYMPMMNKQSVQWLNTYHKEVYKRLAPYLKAVEKRWLKEKCKAI